MELEQLPLGFGLRDDATFTSFYAVANLEAKMAIEAMVDNITDFIYIFGSNGVGKTHLLQAACHLAYERQQIALYLPITTDILNHDPDKLLDLANIDLLCLDDIDKISGLANWEAALFYLYNLARDQNKKILISAQVAPQYLAINLPDLKSRLTNGIAYHLEQLTDEQKLVALKLRANCRGIELTGAISKFLLKRCPRDMHQLFNILEYLDQISLAQKRKITIPFIKTVLDL